MTKIKICGLKLKNDFEFVASLNVDYAGIIFVENVKRQISTTEAEKISDAMNKISNPPKLVGLFADQKLEYIKKIYHRYGLDHVQLCGSENEEFLNELDIPFIKQIKLKNNINFQEIFNQIEFVKSIGGLVSIDTYKEGHYGGSGKLINLSDAKKIINKYKVFLSGGLNSDNITNIIETINPWAVDVSSGVELNNKKNMNKIEKFVNNVRSVKN
jgi:phosphoribosylanthranilate isomerase